ncbi:MAG TPA: hypothetical protein VMG62_07770 [Solirubrobacteraceae bacterium]|nr:hypothetical protein [Solirubrobacteraceae bacterium]
MSRRLLAFRRCPVLSLLLAILAVLPAPASSSAVQPTAANTPTAANAPTAANTPTTQTVTTPASAKLGTPTTISPSSTNSAATTPATSPGAATPATTAAPSTSAPTATTPAATTPAATTPATTTPATTVSTSAGSLAGATTTIEKGGPARVRARTRGPSEEKTSAGAIFLAVLAALAILVCALWALARSRAFEPHWLLSFRHAMAEAGYRMSSTWAEFQDWVRLGR